MRNVGTAADEENGLRVLLAQHRVLRQGIVVQEHEQIDEVGRRRQDRAAMIASAKIHRAEKALQRRVGYYCAVILRRRTFWPRREHLPAVFQKLRGWA